MTNVSNLSVSLRRKTDDLPHSVAQSYWIKKDVSPLLQVPENRQNFKYTTKTGRRTSVVQHGLFLLLVYGLLGGTSGDRSAGSCFLIPPKDNSHYSITYKN